MIVITTLTEGRGTITRGKNIGGQSHKSLVLAVDRWSILLATRSNGGLCFGGWWAQCLVHMEKAFRNMNLDVEVVTKIIAEALCNAFDRPRFDKPVTLAELDKEFSISLRRKNTSRKGGSPGWLDLYDTLNDKFFSADEDEGEDEPEEGTPKKRGRKKDTTVGDKYLPEVKDGTPPIDALVTL